MWGNSYLKVGCIDHSTPSSRSVTISNGLVVTHVLVEFYWSLSVGTLGFRTSQVLALAFAVSCITSRSLKYFINCEATPIRFNCLKGRSKSYFWNRLGLRFLRLLSIMKIIWSFLLREAVWPYTSEVREIHQGFFLLFKVLGLIFLIFISIFASIFPVYGLLSLWRS